MKILRPTQNVLRFIGLLFTHSDSRWYAFHGLVLWLLCSILTYPYSASFVENIKNVTRFSEILSVFSGELSSMAKVTIFLTHKQLFRNLMNGLQTNVNQKLESNRGRRFKAANMMAERIANIDLIAMIHTIVFLCLGPAGNIAYRYIRGQLSAEHMLLPAEGHYPYDEKSGIAFPITYLVGAVALAAMGLTHVGVDTLFIGFSFHLSACFQDLSDMFKEVDGFRQRLTISAGAGTHRLSTGAGAHRLSTGAGRNVDILVKAEFINCLKYHLKIFGLFEMFCQLYSFVIFCQFIFSFSQMCTLAFEMTTNENTTFDRVIANMVMSSIVLTELLVYCYFGNEVTLQAGKVSVELYQIEWYEYPPQIGMMIKTIMARSQTPMDLTGLGLINCSLQNYTSVVNRVGSMLAILRKLK